MSRKIEVNDAARFTVTVGGVEITQADPKGLESMVVEDHVELVAMCRMTVNVAGLDWSDLKIGDGVEAKFGGSQRQIFKGVVTGFRYARRKGAQRMTILAHCPLVYLASSRSTKVYEEMSDSDIVSSVLSDLGVESGTVDSTQGIQKHVIQRNESALEFCKRIAARNGYLLRSDEGKVNFEKAQFSGGAIEIDAREVIDLDYTISALNIPPKLTVNGWSYEDKCMVTGSASDADIEAIGDGENAVARSGTIWKQESTIVDVAVSSDSGAAAMAQAELNRLARGFLRGTATVQGTGALYAGARVSFVQGAEGFNPTVYVVSSRHVVEPKSGYTTEIRFVGNSL